MQNAAISRYWAWAWLARISHCWGGLATFAALSCHQCVYLVLLERLSDSRPTRDQKFTSMVRIIQSSRVSASTTLARSRRSLYSAIIIAVQYPYVLGFARISQMSFPARTRRRLG